MDDYQSLAWSAFKKVIKRWEEKKKGWVHPRTILEMMDATEAQVKKTLEEMNGE
jgi:hypothetical protein